MNIRVFNHRFLEPGSIAFSVIGILFLCQPWVMFLHGWSVLVMLIGLISFNISVHIPPPEGAVRVDEDDTGPVSISAAVKGGENG